MQILYKTSFGSYNDELASKGQPIAFYRRQKLILTDQLVEWIIGVKRLIEPMTGRISMTYIMKIPLLAIY